ncbi:MAG: hypothetical protein NC548_32240 [Lachnospiraceae bacterium]|nr:hypothetical protein [Lachnospiraceae bacterium]MCM1231857.1 hypothetical protein [Ruminococcus flavefaciens]
MLLSVALIGKYDREDLIYALNSVIGQENCDLELIISMDELDLPVCDAIDSINGNRKDNLKKVRINREQSDEPSIHMTYISEQMTGDYLLCLWNGAALYQKDSLAKAVDAGADSGSEFIEAVLVLYNRNQEYLGEKSGGILFPKQFVKSNKFREMNPEYNLRTQIADKPANLAEVNLTFQQHDEKYLWSSRNVPLIKSYIDYKTADQKAYALQILERELPEWKAHLRDKAFKMNYFDYAELTGYVKASDMTREALAERIEQRIEQLSVYTIAKQQGSKWPIQNSKKAYICHLSGIRDLLRRPYPWRFAVKSYIKKIDHNAKKKAVFVVNEYSLWRSCYKSVYDALIANKWLADIVYIPFQHNKIVIDLKEKEREWQQSGYPLGGADYDLSAECPDVIFFCKPYDLTDERWCIKEIEKIMQRIIYIPYSMATMRADSEIKRLMFQLPMHYLAWKQLIYNKTCEKMLEDYSYNPKNKLAIGHPKYDIRITDFTAEENLLYEKIKALAGDREVILWNSHFAIDPQDPDAAGTFLEYGLSFLEGIVSGKWLGNSFVVWRPHPMFWDNIKEYPCINQIESLIADGKQTGRLFVDKSGSQWPAVFASDILVSDSSSLIESWVIYNKPLILTTRRAATTPMDGILYKSASLQELKNAVGDIVENGDRLYEKRKKWLAENYYLPEPGETVAGRLLAEIENDFAESIAKEG